MAAPSRAGLESVNEYWAVGRHPVKRIPTLPSRGSRRAGETQDTLRPRRKGSADGRREGGSLA